MRLRKLCLEGDLQKAEYDDRRRADLDAQLDARVFQNAPMWKGQVRYRKA